MFACSSVQISAVRCSLSVLHFRAAIRATQHSFSNVCSQPHTRAHTHMHARAHPHMHNPQCMQIHTVTFLRHCIVTLLYKAIAAARRSPRTCCYCVRWVLTSGIDQCGCVWLCVAYCMTESVRQPLVVSVDGSEYMWQ